MDDHAAPRYLSLPSILHGNDLVKIVPLHRSCIIGQGRIRFQDRTSTLQHSRRSAPRDTFLDRNMKLCAAAGGIGKHDLSEDFEHLIAHCMSKPFRARLSLESWKVGRYKKLCNEVVQLLVFGLEGWSARGTRLPLVRPVILVVPEDPEELRSHAIEKVVACVVGQFCFSRL